MLLYIYLGTATHYNLQSKSEIKLLYDDVNEIGLNIPWILNKLKSK